MLAEADNHCRRLQRKLGLMKMLSCPGSQMCRCVPIRCALGKISVIKLVIPLRHQKQTSLSKYCRAAYQIGYTVLWGHVYATISCSKQCSSDCSLSQSRSASGEATTHPAINKRSLKIWMDTRDLASANGEAWLLKRLRRQKGMCKLRWYLKLKIIKN